MRGGPDIGDAGIRQALQETIGAPPLREFARGRSSAAILVDDLSRPTPAFRLLPYVLEELAAAGIGADAVKIICALAAHRPMTRDDLVKKVGLDIVDTMQVLNHNAYENLEFLGYSSRGIPIWVNRDMTSCEVRIALGMITPRGGMFGGGAKLLIPGACGQQTILLKPPPRTRKLSCTPVRGGENGWGHVYRQSAAQRELGDLGVSRWGHGRGLCAGL